MSRIARRLLVLVPVGLLGLALVQSASGQDSPSPSATATPAPSAVPALVTLAPIDIGSPDPAASPRATLELASEAPVPSLLPNLVPAPTPIVHPGDGQTNICYECHAAVSPKQKDIASQWKASVHGQVGVGCADCHGGDPGSTSITGAMSAAAGFIGVPDRKTTVGICASCHSDPARMRPYGLPTDMFDKYQASVHGLRLFAQGDTQVAICIDCHGSHDVKKASDPTAAVYSLNIPKLCASCHSDAQKMGQYGIPTDQFDEYQKSIHGQTLLVKQDIRAPTCASCHGSHGAKPPQAAEVVEVCGKCHTATQQLYTQSKHATLQDAAPKCMTCHGAHDVVLPDESRFFHLSPPQYECLTCHNPTDRSLKLNTSRFVKDEDRRCDTCHHPDSLIFSQITAIHDSLDSASAAYEGAQGEIEQAAALGMIVTDADVQLAQSKTSLIQARAAVHTTNLATIDSFSQAAVGKANEAKAVAVAKIDESTFRREAMVAVIGFIVLNVAGLFILKRRLDRELPERE